MNRTRIYAPVAAGHDGELTLPEHAGRHVARVLRLKPGDEVTLFDGNGTQFPATIATVRRDRVTALLGPGQPLDRESPLRIVLAQGIGRGERMDLCVQKATELGVTAIVPLDTERVMVRLDADRGAKRIEHWRQVAISACEQCGRTRLPGIEPITDLGRWLASLDATTTRLLLDPGSTATLDEIEPPADGCTLLVGPEGGLTPAERNAARGRGFQGIRLGPRVLRTETAAIVAVAAVQMRWGDLR